jgi:hypothetical protein
MPKDRIFKDEVKHEEGHVHGFIKTIYHSLNPGRYPSLVSRSWKQALDYLLTLVFFLVFILFLVSIYRFAHFQAGFDNEISKFERFVVDVDYELSEPIEIGGFAMANRRNRTEERVLVTQDGITSYSLICLLLEPACIFETEPGMKTSEELSDALSYSSDVKAAIGFLLVLLLPGLLMFFLVFYALKFLVIVFLASAIAFVVTRLARFEISPKQICLAAVYSSTVMVILEVVNLVTSGFFWIPVIAFMVMYTVTVMTVGEREHAYTKER